MTHTYKGYTITRGAYQGTTDDRMDRWYVQSADDEAIDRRGAGHATLADAKAAIDEMARMRSLSASA